jgi:alpha-ketoglutarate-dependent taurine dioxygenase
MSEATVAMARKFGPVIGGRFGRLVEEVVPTAFGDALPRSLSASYGTGVLPLHVDTAHRLRPARVIILGCVSAGTPRSATKLLDSRLLRWSAPEWQLLSCAVFLVITGRHSFYSSILNDRAEYIRFDPGCMEPIDNRSEMALQLFSDRVSSARYQTVDWLEGRFLVLDNWRMLHGRSAAPCKSGRVLVRSYAA